MIRALTIAGSDPSGGAGIQADLKTFSALGAYGMSVITALTAQSTQGVTAVMAVPEPFIQQQFDCLRADIDIDAIKLGMLMNRQIVMTVADLLTRHRPKHLVVDTVMIAKGGHRLLEDDAITAIRERLLPLATLITPNLPEAATLLGCHVAQNEQAMCEQGKALLALGCQGVLIKGGHLGGAESPDYLITAHDTLRFSQPRLSTANTHGTGCTLSAAITALLPKLGLVAAVELAKVYVYGAINHADKLTVGKGIGPTHHFYQWW